MKGLLLLFLLLLYFVSILWYFRMRSKFLNRATGLLLLSRLWQLSGGTLLSNHRA